VSRSRFYRKNDNAHVEQKNGSVVRELFGELRLDCLDLENDLRRLEAEWSNYCNFFRPTKMIVAKEKKPDAKGYARKYLVVYSGMRIWAYRHTSYPMENPIGMKKYTTTGCTEIFMRKIW
jgi:hypothetical protein